jgi:predicted nucleic acid-binding protein
VTTAADVVFVDTNVLIYARHVNSPFHTDAANRLDDLEAAGAELWISRQTLREYLAGMTRPGAVNPPIPIPTLLADVRAFQTRFLIAEDGPTVTTHLEILLVAVACGGRQIYDANIVATMLAHGIPNVLTHNIADFKRFAGHVTVLPLIPPPPSGVP